jgi:Alpha amylase, catalytic domain
LSAPAISDIVESDPQEEIVNTSIAREGDSLSRPSKWDRYPSLYEINTWIWLSELSRKYEKHVTLSSVPAVEWDAVAACGFDSVWLMGVWERSPAGIAIANQTKSLVEDFRRALPDFNADDNKGSPYCIRNYPVDPNLGGRQALAVARRELSNRGMKLVLDYVPNHVALDHPWVVEHPEYFILGDSGDITRDTTSYVELAGTIYARGRDPNFSAWPDVLQLNAFAPGLRQAAIETVSDIAEQCDGIRCDMAMLLLNEIFSRTWEGRAGFQPATEYWTELISAVKAKNPAFLFIAEAYWDLEWQLQQLGFDFCYDKKLYERLEHNDAESIRLHLSADLNYQGRLVRFIENHDEQRATAVFPPAKLRVSALMVATLPGMRLFHEGQLDGRVVKLPVFLGRRLEESPDQDLRGFYRKLLDAVDSSVFREGQWSLCERTGWPGNETFHNVLAWTWQKDDERRLIIVNFSDSPAQARVQVSWADAAGEKWWLLDSISAAIYERDGDEMISPGLYVDLGPWKYHFLQCRRTQSAEPSGQDL